MNFIGGNGGAGAGTAYYNAALGAAIDHGMADGGGEIGIIHGLRVAGAQVDKFMPCVVDPLFDRFFEMKTGVIATNCNNHFTKSLKVLLCSSSETSSVLSGISI